MPLDGSDPLQSYYRVVGKWHVITCPEADPKLIVAGRTLEEASARAEDLFNIWINPIRPEAA